MKQVTLVAALVCLLGMSDDVLARPLSHSPGGCVSWTGRYSGKIPEQVSAFDGGQDVTVIVRLKRTIYVALSGAKGEWQGAFDAGAADLHCTAGRAEAKLSTGAGGTGHVNVALTRSGPKIYLVLYGYDEGDGFKNQAEYLPPETHKIWLLRTR